MRKKCESDNASKAGNEKNIRKHASKAGKKTNIGKCKSLSQSLHKAE